jgi:transposase InsO family protein
MSKNRVIVEAVLTGQSHAAVAAQYGISKVWVGKLMARWRLGGLEAVEKRSTRPLTNPNAIDAHTTATIIALRHDLVSNGHDAGARSIADYLTLKGHTPPSITTIWRILTREGLITPEPRKRPRRTYVRFEADLPNECWQSDFTHHKLPTGQDIEIITWLDDHSRYALHISAHKRITAATVLNTFTTTINTHGPPASTLTDNGLVFTTRHRGGANAFERELTILGIEQKNGRPNHPQTQGKVERFQQTLKKWLTKQPPTTTLETLQQQLNEFITYYNNERPHRSLHGQTPHHTYTARAKATPNNNNDGHWRIRTDKVDIAGHVTLRHASKLHHIGIGLEHAGTRIRMLINNLNILIINIETGEILRDFQLDPNKQHQPRGVKPGPKKGTPRKGGMPKGYKFKK